MAKELILIDSCVLINAFRKDPKAKTDLMEIMNHTAYSVITHLELLFGANTLTKKDAINKIFEAYYGIPLNQVISAKAVQLCILIFRVSAVFRYQIA